VQLSVDCVCRECGRSEPSPVGLGSSAVGLPLWNGNLSLTGLRWFGCCRVTVVFFFCDVVGLGPFSGVEVPLLPPLLPPPVRILIPARSAFARTLVPDRRRDLPDLTEVEGVSFEALRVLPLPVAVAERTDSS
jgi:hypothetical protein